MYNTIIRNHDSLYLGNYLLKSFQAAPLGMYLNALIYKSVVLCHKDKPGPIKSADCMKINNVVQNHGLIILNLVVIIFLSTY